MIVREIKEEDFKNARIIWEKYYSTEFTFPDFVDQFLCSFVVEEKDSIVCIGGVRTIAEAVILTNKDHSVKLRREAIFRILREGLYSLKNQGYNQLHAFIQDRTWQRHLEKLGFSETKGKSLFLEI